MNNSIAGIAADPLQYDRDELIWTSEGSKDNNNRRLYLECLQPLLKTVKDKYVLDLGCGQGWFCDEIVKHGGRVLGLEPSMKNIQLARDTYPKIEFVHSSLQDFKSNRSFDVIVAIMVLEHFLDLEMAFKQLFKLMKPKSQFITIVGDFNKFTNSNSEHPTIKEVIGPGEVAIKVDYGDRAGIMCDIIRKVGHYVQAANEVGLKLQRHKPIMPPSWHPRYETYRGKPIFHLLTFIR